MFTVFIAEFGLITSKAILFGFQTNTSIPMFVVLHNESA